ncbi:MAG: FAD/NAD(P)-binding protein [Azospirillaceae bacterium]|nr:FAD/NAD(P)-binding protein [Azospirillaceae bacterium]
MTRPRRIAIIGAGFTGTLLAVHLIRQSRRPVEIMLIERSGSFGLGLAYSSGNANHLLNVRAANMSAYPDDPAHFVRWLWQNDADAGSVPPSGHAFVSRGRYGRYVQEQLTSALAAVPAHVVCGRTTADIAAIAPAAAGADYPVVLSTANGDTITANTAVLCIGNFPPSPPSAVSAAARDAPGFIGDPWHPAGLTAIPEDVAVLTIGTGLTMADVVISLDDQGHRGPITALSRRGLLPTLHAEVRPHPGFLDATALPDTVLATLHLVRGEIRRAAAEGRDWRSVIDAMRPHLQRLWAGYPLTERRRFLRHLRPYWDVHRHRMAPAVAARLERWRGDGQLRVAAGWLRRLDRDGDGFIATWQPRGGVPAVTARFGAVVNCSGPECDYGRIHHPLVRDLLDRGRARPDAMRLGLDVHDDGTLIGIDGVPWSNVYALGPVTRGAAWEIVAVPELRTACATLARHLTATP